MQMRILYILVLAVCCSVQCAFAQFNRLFTSDKELPNSLINDVTEGPDEMIWVATEDGLCRFDGSSFTTYRNDEKNPNSLANNFVRTLCADDNGHLLIGSLAGVQLYRPETDDFSPVLVNPDIHVVEGNVNHVSLLRNGDFLVSGTYTFTVHPDENGEMKVVANPFTNNLMFSHRSAEDGDGNIWVIQENQDIYRLDTQGVMEPVRPNGQHMAFTTIACDGDGTLYAAGSGKGIYVYNKQQQTFDLITTPEQNYPVRDFCPVPGTHQMYVGTDGSGAKILDCKTGQIVSFIFDDSSVDASTQKVHAISISKNGEVWMALFQKGVFEMARNPLQFRYFGHKSMRYNCIGDRCITSLLRLHDGTIWVATDNGGLYGINQQGQTLVHYPFTREPNSVPASFMNIYEDSKHRVWFGSYSQGGGIVDLKTGRCTYYPVLDQDGFSANFYAFIEDKRGDIWAATMGLGMLRLNEAKQQFEQVATANACNWACALEYDESKDKLYVGSYDGLMTLSLGQDSISTELSFQEYIVFSITRYTDDKLVLCTNQGLIIYDTNLRTHRRYTTEDGLPNNNMYAALVDNEGNIWMSSNVGLSKLNVEQSQVTNYTVRDGLQGNEFYKNSAMCDEDGTLWFGGTNGITWFKPLSIYQQNVDFSVRIVNCRSYQVNYSPDDENTYNLTEDCHAFSIELATRPIMLTSRVSFRYSMDGDRWQTLPPGQNRVTFARMPSGKHEFRYQAVLDGVGSEVVTSTIFIAYPWYRSWWATILWIGILGLIIWLSAMVVWRRVQMRRRMREHHQHEAINEAKLQFFMNISHEFRTPMTLILTPLQKLMSIDPDAQRQRSYKLIERNANRILSLINELMDLRKIDAEQMQIMCKPTLIVPHVNDLCSTVSDMAEIRKIKLQVVSSVPEDTSLLLDATCFEKILINLLSNALKYTPEGGSIKVLMRQGNTSKKFPEGCVQIEVSDTGIGIPANESAHIFERFYQVRNDISHSVGTGIGLNLVHSLVQLHHGEIEVADTPTGTGTSFIVSLPLGTKLYTADEIRSKREEVEGIYHTPVLTPAPVVTQPVIEIPEPEVLEAEKPAASHKEIAVVEDDEEIRKYIISELSPLYRVKGYPDGKQALEALLTGKFDLVLSDMMMPEMDGEELCRRIRANVRLNHLPIIMLTALTSDEDRLKGLEIGVNAYLTKPFNIEVLKKTVQNLLESQDRLRNNFSGQQLPSDQIETPDLKSPDERLLERVIKVVSENLNNPDLTTDMIAKEIGISRVHLYRKLKELTNQSARNFFRNIRLAKAAELLSKKKMAVSEVAYRVGFANPNNFATAFKELYGISPTQYMEGHRPEPTTFVPNFVDDEPKDADGVETDEASAE